MNDPKKIYSFQEFIDEVHSIKDFFSSRFDFLINNDEISQQGCIIDNVSYYVSDSEFAQPTEDDDVVVNVQVENSCVDKLNFYVGRDFYNSTLKYLNSFSSKNVIGFDLFINWSEQSRSNF